MKTRPTYARCLVPVGLLVGAMSGCGIFAGEGEVQPLHQQQNALACDELDEQGCLSRPDCNASYAEIACDCPACDADAPCPPCECPAQGQVFAGCSTVDPCEGLDEQTCVATEGCEPIYAASRCGGTEDSAGLRAPCLEGEDCGCDPIVNYQGCHTGVSCAEVLCDLYCPYGNATDENGCPVCACNPPPPPPPPGRCDNLDEATCIATPGCEPIYSGGGAPCACPDCPPGSDCGPCMCQRPEEPTGYAGCVAVDPCTSLDESTCGQTPGCQPIYGWDYSCMNGGSGGSTPPSGGEGDRAAPPCDPVEIFYGCVQADPCANLDEATCGQTPGCQPIYVGVGCADSKDPNSDPPEGGLIPPPPCETEVVFAGCVQADPCANLDELTCSSTPGCQPIYEAGPCDGGTGTSGDLRAPPPSDCASVTFVGCASGWACPAVACDLYCEFGNAYDPATGCPICECNPPPPPPGPCDYLDEATCNATAGCQAIYDGGGVCECAPCPPDSDAPCTCGCPAPGEPIYVGCIEVDPCANLDEATCIATVGCDPMYIGVGCACPDCPPDAICEPCDCPPPSEEYAGCYSVDPCSEHTDEMACLADAACAPAYGPLPCPLGGSEGSGGAARPCTPDSCPSDCGEGFLGCYTP